ncbi:MAG TPA: hypothetical protein VFQ90_07310 [Stellaceae bacterium]|nr:hypothetical protein [Stellaceae bacterium]
MSIDRARANEARTRLREANARVEALGAELAALAEPTNRLARIAGEADRAEKRRAELQAKDLEVLGAWLASGEGERPAPAAELLEVEQQLVQLRRDAAAAEIASPRAIEIYTKKAGEMTQVALARDTALYQAAAAIAIDFVDTTLRHAIEAAMQARVKVESLIDALTLGAVGQAGGSAAAERIRERLIPVLRTTAMRDVEAAGRFVSRLCADPDGVTLE